MVLNLLAWLVVGGIAGWLASLVGESAGLFTRRNARRQATMD
jgi:uncharacterized membrane protein YeaQ/YmgE (transglycosylase-associated protein family)